MHYQRLNSYVIHLLILFIYFKKKKLIYMSLFIYLTIYMYLLSFVINFYKFYS